MALQPDCSYSAQLQGRSQPFVKPNCLTVCGYIYLPSEIYSLVCGAYFQCLLSKDVSYFQGLLHNLHQQNLTQFNCWQLCWEVFYISSVFPVVACTWVATLRTVWLCNMHQGVESTWLLQRGYYCRFQLFLMVLEISAAMYVQTMTSKIHLSKWMWNSETTK